MDHFVHRYQTHGFTSSPRVRAPSAGSKTAYREYDSPCIPSDRAARDAGEGPEERGGSGGGEIRVISGKLNPGDAGEGSDTLHGYPVTMRLPVDAGDLGAMIISLRFRGFPRWLVC